jgi:hypothetical protein
MMNTRILSVLSCWLLLASVALAQKSGATTFQVTLEPSKTDRAFAVVRAPAVGIAAGEYEIENGSAVVTSGAHPELILKLQNLKANQALTMTAKPRVAKQDTQGLHWVDTAGVSNELRDGDRPVLRYMYTKLDDSTPAKREETFKVFHHVFSPDGKQLLTKGPGGKFPHHRGLFFGFNKVTYDGKKMIDIWHCKGDAYQSHEAFTNTIAGSWVGGHTLKVDWHGEKKEVFATESRQLVAIAAPGGTLIEFRSTVTPKSGEIKFDGDPQHAGFHFRSSQEVADVTAKETYYLRTDGQGKPGETRNWDPKTKKGPTNLPWNALSMVVGGQRYTIGYLDHPNNPKEARYSERDYGRFGSYFEATATPEKPLQVQYRVWVQAGESTVDAMQALAADFHEPLKVKDLKLTGIEK